MNIIIYILSAMIINAGDIYSYYMILQQKINLRSYKLYIIYLLQTVLIVLNYTYVDNLVKVIFTFMILLLACRFLFSNKKFINCFVATFIVEILVIIAELIFALMVSILRNLNTDVLAQIYEGKIVTNCCITIILIFLLNIFKANKIYNKILKLVSNISTDKIIIFLGIIIICCNLLFYVSYYNTNSFFNLIVNCIITTIYFVIVVMILNKEHKYNVINAKYAKTLDELEEYENIINEYRIINHENKNQLFSIKGMTRNKKVNEYIDEILNSKNKQTEAILKQALLIPTGGLRGLIYSKLILMKNKNINYQLHIDKKINSKLMQDISAKTMLNICQIIGVYLDNAIEAIENLSKRIVMINIYNSDNVVIEIINNIEESFDINQIDKLGYTTKKGTHGYGLSLVNEILKDDKNLLNEREIKKYFFKQKLIIINKKSSAK